MRTTVCLVMVLLLSGCGQVEPAPDPAYGPPDEPWAAEGRELTLLNLYDAFGAPQEGLKRDFGFSTVIRHGGKTILFDAGSRADVFAANLRQLGVDPAEIDIAVGSHRHMDHIAGFDYLLEQNPKVKLYLPPDFFGFGAPLKFSLAGPEPQAGEALEERQRYHATQEHELVTTTRFWKADVTWVKEPLEIAEGVRLIPTASKLMGTFMAYPPHTEEPLLIPMPELSLGLSTQEGEVLVVGCSHSSVEAIVEAAKATGTAPIALVVGGYHLLPYARADIAALAQRLKTTHGVKAVAPAHCSGHVAFDEFRQAYGEAYRFFGLGARIVY